ncbi:MAG: DUF4384 domain-containing protein [Longimicrobiales bacterium]|nr:DUF4384 domain-containing protein [Longimicrobiales bacterium]
MRTRQLMAVLVVGVTAWSGIVPTTAAAQGSEVYPLEARVWLDRGDEPVLQRGERARIYYSVSESAFVAIFHVDTNGAVRMVFPSSPQENHFARGGRDYRVLFPGSSYWYVNDDPGMGYFFIVASPEPFDFRDFGYSHLAGGWDLSNVGLQLYGDPYLAMDDYVATLIPDWEYVGYGLDFTSYHVDRHYEYPRFLCYDCHGFQPYYSWNPYAYSCTSFRVVIYNDPYYYPATRYRGTRVVYVQPRRGVAHFGFKDRGAGEAGTPQVVVRNTPPVTRSGVEGSENRRAVPRTGAPSAFSPGSTGGTPPAVAGQPRPGVEGGANRRPSATGTGASALSRPSSGAQPSTSRSSATTPTAARTDPKGVPGSGTTQRPVLERRPSGTGSSATPPKPTQPPRTSVTRPSVKVTKPRGGGGTPSPDPGAVRIGGATTTRNVPTVRSGSGGVATRSTPTVSNGGAATRSQPAVRSGGTPTRTTPTVRSGGGHQQTSHSVREASGSAQGQTQAAPGWGRGSGLVESRRSRVILPGALP